MSNKDNGPLVSIGVPIYNEERFLEEALDALLAQDYPNIEILISDNASTDGTAAICERYAANDDRVSYQRLPENIGGAANFQHVLSAAAGRYFMWAAGHDVWSEDLVRESVGILEKNSDAALAFATSYWIDAEGHRDSRDTDYPDTREKSLAARFFTVFWGNMHPVLGLIRMADLQETKGLQSFAGGDLVLLSELILRGNFVHADNAWWNRRDIRAKESHEERLARYTDEEYGLATTTLDQRFPLLKLPFALLRGVWQSPVSWLHRTLLTVVLLPAMPVRYIIGRRKANAK